MAGNGNDATASRTVIGPTFTVALPFSKITNSDAEVRDAVADLATLVARLAAHCDGADPAELRLVRDDAEALAKRISVRG